MNSQKILVPLLLASSVASADVHLQQVNNSSDYTIKISKSVLKEDLKKFEAMLADVEKRKLKLHMNAIQLDVYGGEPSVAKDMGRLIRQSNLNTFVAPKVDCVSACIYLAISGIHRMIYGNVLLHRLTLFKEELTEESVVHSIVELTKESNQYIAEMGGSVLLAEAINFTPNWALRRLSEKEIKHWGIFGTEHIYDELMFRRGAKESNVSNSKFKQAYVEYFDVCKKEEYSFKSFAVDCTVNQLKKFAIKK